VSCETEDRHRHEWTNVFTEENAEKAAAGDKLAQERVIQELSEEKRPNREVNRRWMEEEEARMQEEDQVRKELHEVEANKERNDCSREDTGTT
jgi:hypothetical protein